MKSIVIASRPNEVNSSWPEEGGGEANGRSRFNKLPRRLQPSPSPAQAGAARRSAAQRACMVMRDRSPYFQVAAFFSSYCCTNLQRRGGGRLEREAGAGPGSHAGDARKAGGR